MAEKQIGKVTHWYDKAQVAVLRLTDSLATGDSVKIVKGETEFTEVIGSMEIDKKAVSSVKAGEEVAVKLSQPTKEGALIFKIE
jgi:hypothetical protein